MSNHLPNTPAVGMIATHSLVTDTLVFDVIKVTPQTITIRSRRETDKTLRTEDNGSPYPIVWTATAPDPDGTVKTLRRRKDGHFWAAKTYGRIWFTNEDPGRKVDYSF